MDYFFVDFFGDFLSISAAEVGSTGVQVERTKLLSAF
jgi:hypothetical protein